ncbi:carbohydrate ABC transporter permease [Arcanobacterium hippocoleae]|uniref:Multiple sugar transport system permease protein n=1 Tax=Arcanobacterium hippocoleae TaxID=149017 RepID=A0ABU1T2P2_9ACTO|nr:sugar ABC transporter permease [Arcanobacterium hippocoleae]MDR6939655.1 multiple sugar transport system permease protein [Arcanobacterium hippocoleae]
MSVQTVNGAVNSTPKWKQRDKWWAAVFLSPQVIGMTLFTLIPFAFSFYLAFFEWNGFGEMKFVGFDNFMNQINDPLFLRAVLNTLIIAAVTVPIGLFIAILIAVMVNQIKHKAVYMVMLFAPVVTSSVAVALIWQQLLRGDGWLSTTIGSVFGIDPPQWLQDPKLALIAVCAVTIWASLGLNIVIFQAGLQNISPSLMEAAQLDGASRVRSFFSITLPMLSPTIFFQAVIAFISSLQAFDLIFVLVKDAGPENATRTIVYQIYDLGFKKGQLGLSSAAAICLLLLSVVITVAQFGLEKKLVHYDN